jgi:MFS family permease
MIPSLAFLLALTANVLYWLSLQVLYPPLPLYIASIGGTPADNGLATFGAATGAVLSRLFMGTLADHFGRKPVMLIGGIIASVTPVLYGMVHTIPTLVTARVLSGIGIAAFTTGFQALLADLAPPKQRGEVLGWGGNSMALAALIGPLAGDWITSQQGFPVVFGVAALAGAFCTLASLLIHEPSREAKRAIGTPPLQGLQETLALRNVRAGIAAVSPMGMAFGAMVTFWPLVAQQYQLKTVGAFYSVYALGQLTVQTLAGRLSDRIGRSRVMLPGMLLTGVAFASIPLVRSDAASLLVAFVCGAGLGTARPAIDALVLDGVPITLRGTAVAVEFTLNDVWIGLGSALLGSLASAAGYEATYAVAGAACIVVAGALFVFRRRTAASRNADQEGKWISF